MGFGQALDMLEYKPSSPLALLSLARPLYLVDVKRFMTPFSFQPAGSLCAQV